VYLNTYKIAELFQHTFKMRVEHSQWMFVGIMYLKILIKIIITIRN